nr:MAG TPA: hypothetical protein [Caudoviricetes sp.]
MVLSIDNTTCIINLNIYYNNDKQFYVFILRR